MSKRKALLDAACKENVEDFLRFIGLHKDKTEPFDVEEVVQEMPRNQRHTLWENLASLLQDVLQDLPPEQWDRGGPEGMEVQSAMDPNRAVAVVDGVTLVAAVSLKVLQDGDAYSALLQVALRLHDVFVSTFERDAPLQNHIHNLCEAWWKKDLKEKEKFGRTAFFVSLKKILASKKPVTEIQRVWSLHNVLLTLDYTAEDNNEMIDLLLECFHRPMFIKNDNGKRFLVFLFSWNINFIWVLHGTIKNQLEFYSKTMTAHIAEVYFRAWKKATGEVQEQIESSCIQDFMQNAILLRRTSPVHAKVRQVVSYFHSKKDVSKVDQMLCRLYKPILWKALSVPNFEVRANAALVFTEAFPVHDPDQNSKSTDEAIQNQLDTVMTLLNDPHPCVRSTAILGVCKILAKCWELLPPSIITDFLKKLVMEMATDCSSPDVRCSVFKCLCIVLDNVFSHPLLEKFLPALKNSLHDNSEKVRTAFLDMLIKMKAVRAAKFWDVCNVDHLLARLAMDSQSVSKRIVDLLFKSFFPVNESEREWCCRCVTLIQMNPMAARKFYQFAHRHTAPTNIIKLMLAIRNLLKSLVLVDCDQTEVSDSNKENSTQAEPVLGKDTAVVARLLEVLVILWSSVRKALRQNEEAEKYVLAKFGSVLAKYFQALEDEQCVVPLIQLASFMPPAAVPTFSCGVLSKLRKMEPGAAAPRYGQLLECVCSWGQAADVVELITDWLAEALPKEGQEKGGARRKVRIQETVEAKPELALAYLEYLFNHTASREAVLALGETALKQLHTVLGSWRSLLYTHLSGAAEDPRRPGVETALGVFAYHGRLGAHLQHSTSQGREYLLSLEQDAAWISARVLPFLANGSEEGDGKDPEKSQLAARVIESFLLVCQDVFLVGLADEMLRNRILQLCSVILLSDAGYLCVPPTLRILKEVVSSYVPEEENGDPENPEDPTAVILGVVANLFQKVIELLARRLRRQPEEGKQLCHSAVPGLTDFLQAVLIWDRPPLVGVFSTVFAVILVESRHSLQKMTHREEATAPESIDDMPPLSSTLLSVILKSPSVTKMFLAEFSSSLDSEAISGLNDLAAVSCILAVIKHAGQAKAPLKGVATSVLQQLHKHAVTSAGGDGERVVYDAALKTVNEILDL
ncbi:condensin-2 complex subunit G2 isoform X1 [Takifugu flavidus]|uniref:condensin-2 complex subunit G2 isoform X1 n=1 Tax=Takifugu flavidus TaxID=433684 RepID=UPI002544449C|nr:condensin-2 complex subunit G2 isoform X1 [Takifugu flavidus]XP_056869185.1 condensin-2 complex subunit G2 isoform X1 [Takifugu flavidus]